MFSQQQQQQQEQEGEEHKRNQEENLQLLQSSWQRLKPSSLISQA